MKYFVRVRVVMTMEPCRPEEKRVAAAIITEGFMGKFSSLGLDEDVAAGLMMDTWENGPNHRYFVEKIDGVVVAAAHLKWNGPGSEKVSKEGLYEKYGHQNTFKFLRGMEVLYESVDDGDCYIAEFAVTSEHRGKGIAGSVVKSIISFASSEGFERVTLFVSDKNETAIRLYEKMGFRTERMKESPLEKQYFNEPRWRFMAFPIIRSDNTV